MMRRAVLLAALALATPAGAAELRPFTQKDLCLDGGTEIAAGVNRIALAACNSDQTQNFRKGQQNTIYVGSLCLQAYTRDGEPDIGVVAMRCHGRDGQRWVMTRDGRLTSGEKLCLTLAGEGPGARLLMASCKDKSEDQTRQKWQIYGKFDR